MDQIAREAGVSPGLLYNYAEDKQALFQFVLQRELGVDLSDATLPITKPDAGELAATSRRAMRELGTIKSLEQAMRTKKPTDATAELTAIVSEQYDQVHKFRRFVTLSERAARDWPRQGQLFLGRRPRPFGPAPGDFHQQRLRGGLFASVPDPEVAARWVLESV